MREALGSKGSAMVRGNWDWLPQKRKEQYGHMTFSAVNLEISKEYDLFTRIGISLKIVLLTFMDSVKKFKAF